MSKTFDTAAKSLSNAQLATIACKELIQQTNANLSKWELDNLLREAEELEKLSKSVQAEIISISSI